MVNESKILRCTWLRIDNILLINRVRHDFKATELMYLCLSWVVVWFSQSIVKLQATLLESGKIGLDA